MKSLPEVPTAKASDFAIHLSSLSSPVVFRGLASQWPIVKACLQGNDATVEYLKAKAKPIIVGTGSIAAEHQGRLFYNQEFNGFNFSRESREFDTFLKQLESAAKQQTSDSYYMGSTNVDHLMPEFKVENPLPQLAKLNPLVSAWISNQALVAPHQDFPDNLAVCVAGKRRFTLFPPEQVSNLYIGPLDNTPAGQPISLVNTREPDFERFPKYQTALDNALVVELEPGDALLLPSLWWHSVEGLEPINILINYWWQNSANYLGSPMDALFHGIMNIGSLPESQKQAMKALFDHYVFANTEQTHSHIPEQAQGILSADEMAVRRIRAHLLNKLNQ